MESVNTLRVQREQEQTIRSALAAHLAPDEDLLACVQGRHNPGGWRDRTYLLGLTRQRFLLVEAASPEQAGAPSGERRAARVYSLPLALVRSARLVRLLGSTALKLQLGPESLVLRVKGPWHAEARQMVAAWAANPLQPAENAFEGDGFPNSSPLFQHSMALLLACVRDLNDLGLINTARFLLKRQMDSDPLSAGHAASQLLLRKIELKRWGMHIAALVVLAMTVFQIYALWNGHPASGLGVVLIATTLVGLLRAEPAARALALGLGVLVTALHVSIGVAVPQALPAQAWPFIILWGAFGVALLVLLTGKPGWARFTTGSGLFALALAGVLAAPLLPVILPAPAQLLPPVSLLAPAPLVFGQSATAEYGIFQDDFAEERGWPAGEDAVVRMALREGGYAIHLLNPGDGYFAVPPVNPRAGQIEVEARVMPGLGGDSPGAYGAVCRLQDGSERGFYVLIDPYAATYVIVAQDDFGYYPLLDPVWQPAPGLKPPDQSNRFRMRCAGEQISLWINGTFVGQVSDPALAGARGKTALVVQSWDTMRADGFQVIFDNAVVWPEDGE